MAQTFSKRQSQHSARPKQIHDPRPVSGFVPAVLRPTDRPPRSGAPRSAGRDSRSIGAQWAAQAQAQAQAPTPPRSLHSSTDSLAREQHGSGPAQATRRPPALAHTASMPAPFASAAPSPTSSGPASRPHSSRAQSFTSAPPPSGLLASLAALALLASNLRIRPQAFTPNLGPADADDDDDTLPPSPFPLGFPLSGPASSAPASPLLSSPARTPADHARSDAGTAQALQDLNATCPAPPRAHWKPDSAAAACDAAGCAARFALLGARKHHCRRCGGCFCGAHAARVVPIDAAGNVCDVGRAGLVGLWRACDACWARWAGWAGALRRGDEELRRGDEELRRRDEELRRRDDELRRREEAGRRTGGRAGRVDGGVGVGVGVACRPVRRMDEGAAGFGERAAAGGVAASLPRDWIWSTF